MAIANVSACGRFVVVDALHLDRDVFEALARWAAGRGLQVQDAIQLALCAFRDLSLGTNASMSLSSLRSALPPESIESIGRPRST